MTKKSQFKEDVSRLIEPAINALGAELVDVVRDFEEDRKTLSILVDKRGGIHIDECEVISKEIDPMLTEAGLMGDIDMFVVSSPGLDRPLKTEADFMRHKGEVVDIGLYQAVDGEKTFTGTLKDHRDGVLTIDADGEEKSFAKKQIAVVKQHLEF